MAISENLDKTKLAETAMAIFGLGMSINEFGGASTWKAMDWDIMDLLHEKGWIDNPVNKSKAVYVTEEGREKALEFLQKHFGVKEE